VLWLRIVLVIISAVSFGSALRIVRRATAADDWVNRRRAYFTGGSYALIAIFIASLAVWPTSLLAYAVGAVVLVELLVAPRFGPRRL
jgi:hypothetical protein